MEVTASHRRMQWWEEAREGGVGQKGPPESATETGREIPMHHISHSPVPAMPRATNWTRVEEVPKDHSLPLSHKVGQLHTSPHASTQLASWSWKGEKSDRLSVYFPRQTNITFQRECLNYWTRLNLNQEGCKCSSVFTPHQQVGMEEEGWIS